MALYNRVTYDVTDNVRARLEINATRLRVRNSSITYQRDIQIKADNAFLDPAIAAQMTSLGIASFTLGTTNINNLPKYSNPNISERIILGNQQARSVRKMERIVFGLNGDIGDRWNWDAYVHYSTAHRRAQHYKIVIVPNYNLAVDAVRVTAANQGASGIPIGTIVCRSTLTNPTAGFGSCKPLNLFGDGVASQEAIDYVNPPPGSPYAEYQNLRLRQYTASLSVSGEVFDLPAGPVALAFGFDHRRDHTMQTANAMAYALSYSGGNYQPFKRGASTREFFGEVAAPLIKDGFVRSLDVNGAVRATHYAQSGTVITWKGGAVSQIVGDVRIRGTVSRDIRAPSLFQLFNPGSFSGFTAIIPGQATSGSTFAGGNPNLKPERATTLSAGTVLTPQSLDGLSFSADWYYINIKDVFFTPNSIQAFNQCQMGNQTFCRILERDATGQVVLFRSVPVNASRRTVKGVDFQGDYRFDALEGQMTLSATAAYMYEQRTVTPVLDYDVAGSLNLDLGGEGTPVWRGTAKLTYDRGPYSITAQTRHVGSGAVNKQFHEGTGPNSIDNNKVPATAYFDLRGSFNFGPDEQWQVYAAIDNVLDVNPALIPSTSLQFIAGHVAPTNNTYYDSLGRSYRYGIRMKF